MTPLGEKLKTLRQQSNISQKEMAGALGISPAYLSALEHGQRGKPRWSMVQRIITYFNVIWDEAEELQQFAAISDPKVKVDTSSLSPNAMKLANLLSQNIATLEEDELVAMIALMEISTTKPNL